MSLGPGEILKIMGAFMHSKILLTANRIGIFEILSNKLMTSKEVSEKLLIREDYIKIMLDALCSLKLIKKEEGKYTNSNDANVFLVKNSPVYFGSLLLFQDNEWDSWSKLYQTLKTGKPQGIDIEKPMDNEELEIYIKAMDDIGNITAPILLNKVKDRKINKMLDLGCGSGVLGRYFLKYFSNMKLYCVDYPNVLTITKKFMKNYNDKDVKYIQGDYNEIGFNEKFDCVLYSHNIHEYLEDDVDKLLLKIHKMLNDDGILIIHDYFIDKNSSSIFPTIFSVGMMLQRDKGKCYDVDTMKKLLYNTNYSNIEYLSFGDEIPSSAFIAKK